MIWLEEFINNADIVILVDICDTDIVAIKLCESVALNKTNMRVTIISSSIMPKKKDRHLYINVLEKEMKELIDLYRSYEASDKLVLLTNSMCYGTAWNYVKNGIISLEEMFEAILM